MKTVYTEPDLYDAYHIGMDRDIAMYQKLAEAHSEILEIGIGTGRTAIPLAEIGKTVYGIDNSARMIQSLKRKLAVYPNEVRSRIIASRDDMRNFNLERKFSLITIPYSTFNCLLTIEDQKACLDSLRDHLVAQGVLILEVLSFATYHRWLNEIGSMLLVAQQKDQHGTIQMWCVKDFDAATQVWTQNRYYRYYSEEGVFKNELNVLWKGRCFLPGEIQLALKISGFTIEAIYGNSEFKPYAHGDHMTIIKATLD